MTEKNTEQRIRFYDLFAQLVSVMTDFDAINIPLIEGLLVELCVLLRLSKAETFLYNSLEEEAQGKGERLCCFDKGEGEPVASFRVVSSIMTVGKMIVYMKPEDPPLSDDERKMVELAMRATLSFLSRNRYRNVIEMLAFYDDAGYRNLRSLQNHYRTMFKAGQLNNLAAIRYNLRRFSLINHNLGRKSTDEALRNHYKMIEEKAGKDGIVCRLDEGRKVVRISVNLSRKHMMNNNLLEDVKIIIDKYKIPHHYLEFECTETTTDVESGVLQQIVKGMREMGFSTAVDDYGVGYSSLNLLQSIPWNVVKIDRSILPLNADDPNRRQPIVVLKHVVAMLKEIGLECVVEGVETQYQVDLLREMDCDIAQGFFFDRPLLVEDFEKRMENNT